MGRQSELKLKHLLEKGQELFWKYGYSGVTMDQIANEAGISKMTIYKYFPSKEDLFIEILENSIEFHTDRIKEIISIKYHTIEKIETLFNYSIDMAKEYPIALIRDIVERKNIFDRVAAIKKEKALPVWKHILEDGISKNEIRNLDLNFITDLFMNLPNVISNMNFLRDENDMLQFYKNFMDFIKYGLLGGLSNQQYSN
jgi:AcrR family transcriptional regulator